jgi:hypothetical protein
MRNKVKECELYCDSPKVVGVGKDGSKVISELLKKKQYFLSKLFNAF